MGIDKSMNFEKWLLDEENIIFEVTINPNDPDIKKIRRGLWKIEFKSNTYHFIVDTLTLIGGTKGFRIDWGLLKKDDGTLSTDIVGSTKNMVGLFSKIGSCMSLFIRDENPNAFVMYTHERLAKIYDTMWSKYNKTDVFNGYFLRDRKKYKKTDGENMYAYHYYRKPDDAMNEEQWNDVLYELQRVD
jgi:hypothetical protein